MTTIVRRRKKMVYFVYLKILINKPHETKRQNAHNFCCCCCYCCYCFYFALIFCFNENEREREVHLITMA